MVKYNTLPFAYYEDGGYNISVDEYLTVAKLAAILRVVNALDRSHRQKFTGIKVALKDKELVITVETTEDISLERGLFAEKAEFFEEVYSIRPVLRQKKSV